MYVWRHEKNVTSVIYKLELTCEACTLLRPKSRVVGICRACSSCCATCSSCRRPCPRLPRTSRRIRIRHRIVSSSPIPYQPLKNIRRLWKILEQQMKHLKSDKWQSSVHFLQQWKSHFFTWANPVVISGSFLPLDVSHGGVPVSHAVVTSTTPVNAAGRELEKYDNF